MTIGIDPVVLDLGSIALSWHGLFLAAGVLVVYAIAVREGRRQGFSHRSLSELALWMALAGLGGARLLGVAEAWPVYAADPARILAVPEGGLTVNGAILGGIAAATIYARRRQLDGWRLLDVLALAVPAGCIVGRVGCAINGDVWGLPTGGPWGLVYLHSRASIPAELLGVPTFPAPAVLQVWNVALLALLLVLRRRAPYDGLLVSTYLIGYGAGRFITNCWQGGEPILPGLKFVQLVALGLILLGVACLVYLRRVRGAVGAAGLPGVQVQH